jgi:hypothetical protein
VGHALLYSNGDGTHRSVVPAYIPIQLGEGQHTLSLFPDTTDTRVRLQRLLHRGHSLLEVRRKGMGRGRPAWPPRSTNLTRIHAETPTSDKRLAEFVIDASHPS